MNSEKKTTSAGKWSVALACVPLSAIILLMLTLIISTVNASADIRLASVGAFGLIILIGLPTIFVASSVGLILGIVAFRKSQHKNGKVGLTLNLLLLGIVLFAMATIAITFYAN